MVAAVHAMDQDRGATRPAELHFRKSNRLEGFALQAIRRKEELAAVGQAARLRKLASPNLEHALFGAERPPTLAA